MKSPVFGLAVLVSCFFLVVGSLKAEPNKPVTEPNSVEAAVIVCKGMIDDGLYKSIRRRTELALDGGAEYLIYEIGTYGGLLEAGDNISKYLILEVSKKAHTVAYITTEAISAGAMISVSCRDIIMVENTTIGDCAPMAMGDKLEGVEREKTESFVRATFDRASEANKYPAPLLRAMVTMQIEVYRVRNLRTEKYEFFEGEKLPNDPNEYDLANKELIDTGTQLLTLTASKANEYGIARAVVEDLAGVLDFLAQRDGVEFTGEPLELETIWSEDMVRRLNSPVVVGLLMTVALLAVYIELSTPGIGLPGLTAAICFAIIIGSKYLIGMANWVEVAVFIAGIILLLVEIFVLPGFGIAGVLGIIFIFSGMFGMLVRNPPGKLPWPETSLDWEFFTSGLLGLLIGFSGFVVLALLLTKYMPRLQFLSGLLLSPAVAKTAEETEISMTAPPESRKEALKVGDIGRVISRLRPAGKAKFRDAIVDVIAEGEFIESGCKVKIVEIHGNKVVVKITEDEN